MDIKCIIVDDDLISVEIIRSYIENVQGIEIVKVCNDAISAFEVVQQKAIDLVFLDLEMPKLSGIEFIKTIRSKKGPRFIITSASKEHAVEAYELDVLDYMIKPIHFDRFLKAINKYYQYASSNQMVFNSFQGAGANHDGYIYIKENKKVVKIFLKDILFIESIKNYVRIVSTNKSIVTKQQITFFEEALPKDQFLRIHRSFIVSISKIEAFTAAEIEIGNKELPIGRSYKKTVLNSLNYNDID